MPVVVQQTRRTTPTFNGLYPGGVAPDWLLGNVSNYFKTELLVRVGQFKVSQGDAPITLDCPQGDTQTRVSLFDGTWSDEGIGEGDTVNLLAAFEDRNNPGNPYVISGGATTVLDVSADGKTITCSIAIKDFGGVNNVGSGALFPTPLVQGQTDGRVRVWVVKTPDVKVSEVEYNLLANSDKSSNSMNSIIDGSVNKFKSDIFDPQVISTNTLTQLGFKSGGAIKSVDITTIPSVIAPNGFYTQGEFVPDLDGNPTTFQVQQYLEYALFRVEIISMIWGLEEDVTNFDDNTPPSWFNDVNCLGDNFTLRFFNDNTNTNKVVVNNLNSPVTQLDGNTGWVNENYNGRPVPYTLVSTDYYNVLGTPINFVDYGNQTKVDTVINNPNHTGSSRYTIAVFHLPNELTQNEYSYLNNTFANTPIYNNAFDGVDTTGYFLEAGLYGIQTGFEGIFGERMDISDIAITDLGSDNIQISFRTIPNSNYFNYFDSEPEDNRRLLILIGVQDWDEQQDTNQATQIVAGYDEMIFVPIPVGEYPYMSNTFLELPVDKTATGATECIGFVEDLWLTKTRFQIDLTSGIVFNSIIPTIELINSTTGEVVELDKFEIDLTSQPTDGSGIQQFNINQSGRFITSSTNDKNILVVERLTSDDVPPFYHYGLNFPFRLRYEDWISRPNIPNELVDIAQANNGMNNDWAWLQQTPWELKLSIYSNTTKLGETALYKNSYPITIKDYFEQGLDAYQEFRHFEESTGNPLYIGNFAGIDQNAILEFGITRVQVDTILNTGVYPASGIYSWIDIQVDEGSGFKSVRTLSSIYEGEPSDPLKPTGGNGNLLELVLVNTTTLRSIVLIDPSLLENAINYRITCRIGCSEGNILPTLPSGSPYDSQYNNKYL